MQTAYAVVRHEDASMSVSTHKTTIAIVIDESLAEELSRRNGWWGGNCRVEEAIIYESREELEEAGFVFRGEPLPTLPEL